MEKLLHFDSLFLFHIFLCSQIGSTAFGIIDMEWNSEAVTKAPEDDKKTINTPDHYP